eukprot:GHVU01012286.1.p1 GENE.GHVU01012286.1~~GHVU01012286.1.p1  ORF type:complete len:172 (+),score=25.18 GHVU01012286.1:48-518(+)
MTLKAYQRKDTPRSEELEEELHRWIKPKYWNAKTPKAGAAVKTPKLAKERKAREPHADTTSDDEIHERQQRTCEKGSNTNALYEERQVKAPRKAYVSSDSDSSEEPQPKSRKHIREAEHSMHTRSNRNTTKVSVPKAPITHRTFVQAEESSSEGDE